MSKEGENAAGDGGEKPVDVAMLEDKLEASSPTLDITLAPGRLAFHVAVLCLFVGAFTGVALWGITLPETIYDKVGSSTNANKKTDTYNFRSGLVMAFIEVVMGWWLDKIQPTYIVFLHNLLWSSKETTAPSKVVGRVRSVILFVVPILVVLTLGNSIRGFQASNSTVGFNSTMILDDFQKSQSSIEKLQADALKNDSNIRRPSDTILKNAVRQQTTPFSFIADATCTQQNSSVMYAGESLAPINVDDLASIAAVYGFYSNEWNTEINFMNKTPDANYSITYSEAQGNSEWPEDFDIVSMINLFFHGTVMLERAIANAERRQHNCSESDSRTDLDVLPNESMSTGGWTYATDGTRICQGPATSLFTLTEAVSNITSASIDSVMNLITTGLNKSFPSTFALDETTVSMEKLSLTNQMRIEALTIDVALNTSVNYGWTIEDVACNFYDVCGSSSGSSDLGTNASSVPDYLWSYFSTSFCGNTSCVFFDFSNAFKLQKEIGVIPLVDNCSEISYDANYGGWYPVNCEKVSNQAVIYGIGSYISGDTFAVGGLDGEYQVYGENLDMYLGPYIENPRRHIQFSFALLSWETQALHDEFDAQCDVSGEDGGDCTGMWYQLPQTKRYLFAGEDALPIDYIMEGDFHSPTPLVQLNSPSFVIHDTATQLEYLNPDNFLATQWNSSLDETLGSDSCSSLMESYLSQLGDNNYFLERPLEVMYTSVFFLFMQDAAVTDLSSSSSSSSSSKIASSSSDLLANVQLKGDRQLRRIAMSIPSNSFWISFVGCIVLVAIMFLILTFPIRRPEYFEPGTTTAEKFVALKTNADYPDLVYKKTLVPTKSVGVDPPIMNAFKVESMTLVHRSRDRTQQIEL
ncbi:hypothetical protein JG687_00001157 [Phytophthora cactorum]|uniref:Uncharacterized protein n=2 Tax=Phytophthora cactorum TaxID=29920 RepID=A0A329RSQ9_9STRA|nr:hypothetical protein Pcac1_g13536 [Phytophthora cactorum]KAG2840854.1 hypothetical protein PC112_g3573 [Phytophthora cactorum]KAG2842655.1 hypothetical protein PC111_g2665 [Phytophthora cactorum]KAG2867358.1 hypothetical protein PC113_g2051 [Phytophthora cactorum]KAG2924865.1 hypothetical protein PC114_g4316 [Phytophthora cactorum]